MADRRIVTSNSLQKIPEAEVLMHDAMRIVQNELVQYTAKARNGKLLTLSEARVLQGYIKSLAEISKEAREQAKQTDLTDMSPADLVDAMAALMSPADLEAALKKVQAKSLPASSVAAGIEDEG